MAVYHGGLDQCGKLKFAHFRPDTLALRVKTLVLAHAFTVISKVKKAFIVDSYYYYFNSKYCDIQL